jgi:hypothetical protein
MAPLLPLASPADAGLLARDDAARVRAHAATCPHCEAVLAGYSQVDRTLRGLLAGPAAHQPRLTEEIMESIEARDHSPAAVSTSAPTRAAMSRLHRLFSPAGAIAAVVLISLGAAALFAWHGSLSGHEGGHAPGPPRPTFSPSYMPSAIVAGGANGTWILATYQDALCAQHQYERERTPPPTGLSSGMATPDLACAAHPLLLRWDGQQWYRVNVHVPASSRYSMYWQVSVLRSGEAFAANGSSMLHLRNGTWSVDPVYAFPQTWMGAGACSCVNIESLDMVSPQEGWAAGGFYSPATAPAIAHYRDGQWTLQSVPDLLTGSYLHSISMASPDEGWAVGYQANNTETFTEHYQNGQWTRVDPIYIGGSNTGQVIPGSLNAVQTLPDGEAWAVGELNPSVGPGLILHWVNGTWHIVDTGIPENILHALTMVSPTEGWVTGDGNEILHLHNGAWTKEGQTIHQYVAGPVVMVSPTEGWAIGTGCCGGQTQNSNQTLIDLWHFHNGTWSKIPFAMIIAEAIAQAVNG